jgi:hypothetical protein
MAKENIFKTKLGFVSAYSLACGYVQIERVLTDLGWIEIELNQDGGCKNYNVVVRNNTTCTRLTWDSCDNLKDARKRFAQVKRNFKNKRAIS